MKYFYDFPLTNIQRLIDFVKEYTASLNDKQLYVLPIMNLIPFDVLDEINTELIGYGLPKLMNISIFKRKNSKMSLDLLHTDAIDDDIVHSSVVIPVTGYENTFMYWMDGPHRVVRLHTETGGTYNRVEWISVPRTFSKFEITKPTLCRVDVPHSATSRDNMYRTVVTMRFEGNPTVDEIIKIRNLC